MQPIKAHVLVKFDVTDIEDVTRTGDLVRVKSRRLPVVTVREWFRKTRRISNGIPDWDEPLDVVLATLRRRIDALDGLHKLARSAEFNGPFLTTLLAEVHTDDDVAARQKQAQLRQALEERRCLEAIYHGVLKDGAVAWLTVAGAVPDRRVKSFGYYEAHEWQWTMKDRPDQKGGQE